MRATHLMEQLYLKYWRELNRYIARRFGPGSVEPEDVAQAAFAKLAESSNVAALNDPRSYLWTIACNIAIDDQRRRGYRNAVQRELSALDADDVSELSPERVLQDEERMAVFGAALRAMPKLRRRIFLLVRVEEQSPRDVAQQFGLTEAAVYKHIQRALQDCVCAFAAAEKTK
ncbi:RNA polymerase sigma factor [Steroidobacter cummioxidans]|uniref:RNA polymerase sigma factor n=1 Tax=Steroidobacter cummioxidans TaxID=1803913 RepID=UPI000E31C8C8|nr:sigma-70 family RNA polymerase sigma factor [Steroidobacter cummioxidans]